MSKLPVDFATWGDKLLADFADRNKVLDEKLRIATEALEFYEDRNNWDDDFNPTVWYDGNIDLGRCAREALAKIQGEK